MAILLALAAALSPAGDAIDGWVADAGLWARHRYAPAHEPVPTGRVAVVAIDERTYAAPPFSSLPLALWAPFQATLLDALLEAGASVVGYDLVFATSTESAVRRYDRSFRAALQQAAADGRVVLGEFLGAPGIRPHASWVLTVGGPGNIRPLDVAADRDGILRRIPLELVRPTAEQGSAPHTGSVPSFATELAGRMGLTTLPQHPDGVRVDLGVRRATVPAYSFAELHACAVAGDAAFFREHFAGRAVLIGVDLAVEDRHLAANRFIRPASPAARDGCAPTADATMPAPLATMPGVFLQAAAVDQLLDDSHLREVGPLVGWLLVLAASMAAMLPPLVFARGTLARLPLHLLPTLVLALAAASLLQGLVLPAGRMLAGALTAFGVAFLHRAGLIDRDRWRLRRTLGLYLPSVELRRLQRSGRLPELGGETRTVTILFVDVANFSRIAEASTPAEITARLNAHFERLAHIVERHGGIVDRFVGDAVIALFGAPVAYADHARRAVEAANEIVAGPAPAKALSEHFRVRVSVTTGPVLVGNIGSRRRFNYSAIGDTVNLASRLEGLNKLYGSSVLISGSTVERCPDLRFREVDRVKVVGRDQPVDVYVPLHDGPAVDGSAEQVFARALALYRQGAFAAATDLLEALAIDDPIAGALLARCRRFAVDPPAGWDGTWVAETK